MDDSDKKGMDELAAETGRFEALEKEFQDVRSLVACLCAAACVCPLPAAGTCAAPPVFPVHAPQQTSRLLKCRS